VKKEVNFRRKAAFVLAGLFVSLILLEAGLRLGGFVFLSLQERRNRAILRRKDSIRVLCLGESTTAGEWPPFLQEILDNSGLDIEFSVIDKGVPGTNTNRILSELEPTLDKYNPDIVITMMGINDFDTHMFHVAEPGSGIQKFLQNFRSYNLFGLVKMHLAARFKSQETLESQSPKSSLPDKDDMSYQDWRNYWISEGEYDRAEKYFKKALKENPDNDYLHVQMGNYYRQMGDFTEADKYVRGHHIPQAG